jgi:UDP-N-acetylglucosamine 1-carboxyvinyltransferase
MDKLIINGPCKLSGEVEISSAKNASLPILFASLLVPGKTVLLSFQI